MLTVTDLTTLDPNEVEQFRQQETTMVQAYNPDADLKRGPIQDLVITIKAALDTATQTNIDLVRQSSSLLEVTANPALADATTVDRLLANYGLTRKPATVAAGNIAVVLAQQVPVVVPPSTTFTISGRPYQPTLAIAARTAPASVTGPGDRLLLPQGGNWYFLVPVQALVAGAAGNARSGTTAVPSQPPPQFVKAYAAGDISGGQDQETNQQLLGRLQSGLAFKAWGNRATIDATLRAQFPTLLADSIVGFGDPEMLRDVHSVWPGHTGGRVDVYLRTAPTWVARPVDLTATLVALVGSLCTWQVPIGRDSAPGYYEVDTIRPQGSDPTTTSLPVLSDVRGLDLTIDSLHPYVPDLVGTVEGVYSRYQTATVQFTQTVTSTTGLVVGVSTAIFTCSLRTMPLVAESQDYLGGYEVRPPMSDVLAKGAVPCFTTVAMILNVQAGAVVDVPAVRAAVASAVNALGFAGGMAASLISQVVHGVVGAALVSITGMALAGRLRRPDGTNVSLSDPVNLMAPDDPAHLVSARTVVFLLDAADITVSVVPVA